MTIALIAGEGGLPVEIAKRLSMRGEPAVVYSLRGDSSAFNGIASAIVEFSQLDAAKMLGDMAARGARKVVMAGLVPKTLIYSKSAMDSTAAALLQSLGSVDDHSLLGAIVGLIEKTGFRVEGYRSLLPELFAKEGHIAGREPSDAEKKDAAYGFKIAKATVPLSFGQSVVVSGGSVAAVEAIEGTDAAIKRAGLLCKGGTVVKMMRPDQDDRYDIPVVGAGTIRSMSEAGIGCLALEAGNVLIMDPEEFRKSAESAGISVIGVEV